MGVGHLSLKQLTLLASLMMASVFVCCYLTFRFFWAYDAEVEQAIGLQQEETQRVKTVLDIQKTELAKSLIDYAAWDDVIDFIDGNNPELLTDSLNSHTFETRRVSGIFIFDENVSLVWGRRYDYLLDLNLSFEEVRYKFGPLLVDALKARTDKITPFVKFLVLDDRPHLFGTSRICNSEGRDCTHGYMMFIKPIDNEFSRTLKNATGIDIEILTAKENTHPLKVNKPNTTVLEKLDYQNRSTVCVLIKHSVKLPDFITWGELSMLFAFAGFMFVFNLSVAHVMVRPIKRARLALNSIQAGERIVSVEEQFISHEMKDFVCRINEVYAKLDEKQQELEWIARHDALTKVGNRRSLQQHWYALYEQSDHGFACVALIDIDYFKPFNDNYGHIEGDSALSHVAKQLQTTSSKCDKFVSRFGGEEFCVVFTSKTPIDVMHEGEALRQAIEQLHLDHQYSPISSYLTVSIGMADCQNHSLSNQKEVLQVADKALYEAKEQGRNRVVAHQY
ncbi:diguanylate cyclase [Vibrio aquaticus]|uniref:diguanylate cyclase n=2 Tax=Vibrio aquaticus TaxID=2496559 RepID=A0A432CYB8_9VIBR|nr:diguanylate cyclase [Vibrio aquaticus]